jgi:lysyl-tRNA synthetase class II
LINRIAVEVNGTSVIKARNKNGEYVDVDLSREWRKVDFMGGLEAALGTKLPVDFRNEETIKFYSHLCEENHVACEEPRSV